MKLIRATVLSTILNKRKYFVSSYCYNRSATGIIIINKIAYFNIPMAKKLACQLSQYSSKPLDQILQEIDDYEP